LGAGVGGTDVCGGDIAFYANYTRLCPEALAGGCQEANARPETAACHKTVIEASQSASAAPAHIFCGGLECSEGVQAGGTHRRRPLDPQAARKTRVVPAFAGTTRKMLSLRSSQ